MNFEHGVVALTEHKDVLERLRRMRLLKKDAEGKEFYTAQFDGRFIDFYAGQPKSFPVDIARAIENGNHTYLDEKCVHCKGQGSTAAGICINCKGKKLIKSDEQYRVLKVVRTYDAMLVDPASIPPETPAVVLEPISSAA